MQSNSNVLSLNRIFGAMLKRWWIILIATIVGAVAMFAYTYYLVTPTYTTKAKLGVNYVEMSEYQNAVMGQSVAKECAEILVSNVTLEKAAEELNAYSFSENGGEAYRTYTADNLHSMIKTYTTTESRYFTVEVTATNPKEAKIVCEFVTKAFCDVIEEKGFIKGAEGRIIHHPVEPTAPSSPNLTSKTVVGGIIGFVVAAAVLITISLFKDLIEGEDWLIETYKDKIPLLAVIPDANSPSGGYRRYAKKYGYGYGYATKNAADVTDAAEK